MPRYRVKERRCYVNVVIIDAADEDAARRFDGEVVDGDMDGDSWPDETLSIEEIDA